MLGWDQETYMPREAAELRGNQLAMISGLHHRRQAATEFRDLIGAADDENADAAPDSVVAANLREARRDYELATKVPAALVEEKARTTTLARRAWAEGREANDFARFCPWFEKIIDIARRMADALGYDEHPYDALLDKYEQGATTAQLQQLFAPLRDAHVDLVARIQDSGRPVDASCLRGAFPADQQDAFAREVTKAIGFDYDRGRLDTTVHPFCMGVGPTDVRLTTRYDPSFFGDGLFSALHEAGHGMYEQGVRRDDFGLPSGQSCSLGIHESQSRLWENLVGRSRGFWTHFYGTAQKRFASLSGVSLDDFLRAINEVRPSFIRVDADEVTYNLHVFLRFELELALISGDLAVADLPDAWNEKFEQSFRLRPPNDAKGCLQDIHWSAGLFGYFPTYTLGNVYAAQIYNKARAELGDLEAAFARGEFTPLRSWLNREIHERGRQYLPHRLVEKVTGAVPQPQPLIDQLESKYGAVYGL